MYAVNTPAGNAPNAGSATSTSTLQQKTQQAFVTLTLITQACHGIVNTVLIPPSPKPAWFDGLQAKLDSAKENATQWIDNIAPNVTGGVPLQVINYGTTYSAFSEQITDIVNANPDAQGATNKYVVQVKGLIAALEQAVTAIIANADTTAGTLKEWGDKMQRSHDDLVSGAANIQGAETDLSTDIAKMNNAISTLNEMIHKENIAIAASAGGIGLGLLLLVAGIALAPETGGASAYLVAGTGAALIIGGSVTWGVMQAKIDKQFKEIAADQNELNDDNRQLVALQGLASASDQSIQYVTDSTNALSDFRTSWSVFQGELQGVKSKLDNAEASLSTLLQGAFTAAATAEWADATNFAQSLASAPVQVAAKQLPMQSQAA
jgi:ABC-type transporter Mla subunit MlaD